MSAVETLVLEGADPSARGEQHGEAWRDDIRALYEIRLGLMFDKTDLQTEQEVLDLAARHLPVLEHFDPGLSYELTGIARGAGLTPAHIVVLNHYTDLRDLGRAHLDDSGCTVLYAPAHDGQGPFLGQTWDTHGSATDYVRLLDIREPDRRTLLFTIAGCLGMAGLNDRGVGVAINNLICNDARVGIVWPALVRRMLAQDSARAARDEVLAAPLGSGHHYMVADEAEVFGVEANGTDKKVIQEGAGRTHLHTNHCLDDELAAAVQVAATSTTYVRYDAVQQRLAAGEAPGSLDELFAWLVPVSYARDPDDHNAVATCGAMVMELGARHARSVTGPAREGAETTFTDLSKRSAHG